MLLNCLRLIKRITMTLKIFLVLGLFTYTLAKVNLGGTNWDWLHDGKHMFGTITFTRDGRVRWNDGAPQGSWGVDNNILVLRFNGVIHRLELEAKGVAVVLSPKRNPPSRMIQNETPNLAGTVWDWLHDGKHKAGEITLTEDGKVKVNAGAPQGRWGARNNIVRLAFNNVNHILRLDGTGAAVLLKPKRNPPSKMIRHDKAKVQDPRQIREGPYDMMKTESSRENKYNRWNDEINEMLESI